MKFYVAGGNGGGKLPDGKGGFNYQQDVAAARIELTRMPIEVSMVFAGGSGGRINIGECLRKAPADNLIRRSYEAYFRGKDSMNRPTWDRLRVLYACRPSCRALFDTSPAGDITLGEPCLLTWHESPHRNKAYAYVREFDAIRDQITEFMMHKDKLGTTAPTLNFNLYLVSGSTTAEPLVLSGGGLLNAGAGIAFTPTQTTTGDQAHMAISFTGSDIYSLTSGTGYALAITSSDVTFHMRRRGGGNEMGGYGYKDLAPVVDGGRALLVSTYDTALVPEPGSVLLLGLGAGLLLFRRRS